MEMENIYEKIVIELAKTQKIETNIFVDREKS